MSQSEGLKIARSAAVAYIAMLNIVLPVAILVGSVTSLLSPQAEPTADPPLRSLDLDH